MAIVVVCPDCRTRITLGDDRAGETLECPRCDVPFPVPDNLPEDDPPAPEPAQKAVPKPPGAKRRKVVEPEEPEPIPAPRGLVAGLVAGVALLLVGGGLVAFAVSRRSVPQEVAERSPAPANVSVNNAPPRVLGPPVGPSRPTPPEVEPKPKPTPKAKEPEAVPAARPEEGQKLTPQWFTVTNPKPLSDTVKRGLAWLVSRQKGDGGWASEDTGTPGAPPFVQKTGDNSPVTATALALLALVRAGGTPADGAHAKNILRAIDFLCKQVEQADAKSSFVTGQRGTIVQMKMGEYFDTYVAAWALAEVAGRMPDAEGNRRVRDALTRVIAKVERAQLADGSWFDNSLYDTTTGRPTVMFGPGGPGRPPGPGGPPGPPGPFRPGMPGGPGVPMPALAPVLGQAVAVKGLHRARQAGFEVDAAVLEKARTYAHANFNAARGEFGLKGSYGIVLYASASHLGAMQDAINTRRMFAGAVKREELEKDVELRDRAFQGVVAKLNDRRFLMQFGSYGGEDFLGYMLLSEAMAVKSDDTWRKWDDSMTDQLGRQQNADGSWTGHHCTTGRSFCTASVVLVLAADRAPVPQAVIQGRN